jgi:hypothetical protein
MAKWAPPKESQVTRPNRKKMRKEGIIDEHLKGPKWPVAIKALNENRLYK